MSLFVKICGLKSAADVDTAVDAGADAVGFVFADSPRRVTPAEASAASRDLPAAVRRVAVMRHPTNTQWRAVLDGFRPDVLQTDAGDFETLDVPAEVERWPVLREGRDDTGSLRGWPMLHEGRDETGSLPGVFLYEGPTSGAGVTVDWALAASIARRGHMILAGGLSAANVGVAITTVRPHGVDVSSAVESEPGVKDPKLIREFIEAARAAEQTL